jgi:acetylornithine deacetylase/succinyl-diaminopimelate desuccinylase-like protein
MVHVTTDELNRLFALLRIPSISALPDHRADMVRAAGAFADEIRRAGGAATLHGTVARPFVIGEVAPSDGRANPTRVLIYGHYDVQPVGDVARWDSPPFEPEIRGEYLYARGASDDKGNLFQVIVAVQRLTAENRLPVHVTFLIDGEEESGGTAAIDWVDSLDEVPDIGVIWDGGMLARGRPSIETGVRGLCYRRVTVTTGTLDGHSGLYGGVALNAAHALTRVLAAVQPRNGRLPDALSAGVGPVSEAERAGWDQMPPGDRLLEEAGLRPADATAGEEFAKRTLASPSVDVHAIWCGDADAVKTVIPSVAHAMVSVRVAPGQDAAVIGATLDRLLREAAPDGATVEVENLGDASPALMDPEHPVLKTAAGAIAAATGAPVTPVRTGGTLPIFATMVARMPTVLTGFALPDDAIHSPNERMLVENLGTGVRAAMAMLEAFGR